MQTAWTILSVTAVLLASFAVIESGPDRYTVSPGPAWHNAYACQTNVCQNGGTCFEFSGITLCLCPHTHIGHHCETENGCYYDPCMNGGLCEIDFFTGQQYCVCRDGWTGQRCQTETTVTSCTYVNCEHGGTCYHYDGSTFCNCSSPYGGFFCETEHDEPCHHPSTQCANGGSCFTDRNSRDYCQCTSDWVGSNCTQPYPVTEVCDSFCENGGSCYINVSYMPACHCQPGWRGERCSEPTSFQPTRTTQAYPVTYPCLGFCKNGGTCSLTFNNRPVCLCRAGWQGKYCSERTHQDFSSSPAPPPRNGDGSPSGLDAGGIVGLSVGIVVLLMVVFGSACIVAMIRASKNRRAPHQHNSPGLTTVPPSVIYNPNIHGYFGEAVDTVQQQHPEATAQPAKDVYGSDRFQSNIPRRYTPSPVRQQSSGVMPNPGAGTYNYAFEHGSTQNPSSINTTAGHEYAYADPVIPSSYTSLQPVPQQTGPPPPYTKTQPTAYSKDPSRAPSKVSEHTYQSIV